MFNKEYAQGDVVRGKVETSSAKGLYLTLENGHGAFAANFSPLPRGTHVLCTILKQTKKSYLKLVAIDSVDYTLSWSA